MIRAKGRKHYIFYTGSLRSGMSVFALTTLWDWHDKYGWHAPVLANLYHESADIAFRLVIWLTVGYFWGAAMWKQFRFADATDVESNS